MLPVQVPRKPSGIAPSAAGTGDPSGERVDGAASVVSEAVGPGGAGAGVGGRLASSCLVAGALVGGRLAPSSSVSPSFISAYTEPPAPSATISATTSSAVVERPLRRSGAAPPGVYGGGGV